MAVAWSVYQYDSLTAKEYGGHNVMHWESEIENDDDDDDLLNTEHLFINPNYQATVIIEFSADAVGAVALEITNQLAERADNPSTAVWVPVVDGDAISATTLFGNLGAGISGLRLIGYDSAGEAATLTAGSVKITVCNARDRG